MASSFRKIQSRTTIMTERKTAKTLKSRRLSFALQNVCIQLYSHPAWVLYVSLTYTRTARMSSPSFYSTGYAEESGIVFAGRALPAPHAAV
jgi:hypothetical protein